MVTLSRTAVSRILAPALVALLLLSVPAAGRAAAADPFGDFNGDGWSDVLHRISTSSGLFIRPGGPDGFGPQAPVGTGWAGMNALVRHGDLTGDGRDDVLARQAATGDLWVYPGTGNGAFPHFGARVRYGASGWNGMRELTPVGDFDGDGRGDLLAVQASTGRLFLYPNRGGSFGPGRLLGTGWNGMDELTGMGDTNEDGRVDLLARQRSTNDIWVYPVTGTGTAARLDQRTRVGLGAAGWAGMESFVSVGDIDQDGSNDLLAVEARGARTLRGYGLVGDRLFLETFDLGPGWTGGYRPIL